MQFSVLALTALAVITTASPTLSNAATLGKRRDDCGEFWDAALGISHTHPIPNGGRCQNTAWSGESPNDQSSYGFSIADECQYCNFYASEGCQGSPDHKTTPWGDQFFRQRSNTRSFSC